MTGPNRAPSVLPAVVLALSLASVSSSFLFAQAPLTRSTPLPAQSGLSESASLAGSVPLPLSSSSSPGPNLSVAAPEPLPAAALVIAEPPPPSGDARTTTGMQPFSALAVAVKVGIAGIGFDVATPLAQRFNLRGGASFFSYNSSYNVDGTTVNGDLKLRSVNLSADWFPFNNRFRISPGVILYNGNTLNATASVPGGQTFTLDDTDYTSSPTDPVRGSASLLFGKKAAPSLTVGTGNMIPRHGGHISIPFEIGFEYITSPTFLLNLQGTACSQGICQSTANPQFQANLQGEQNEINSDIAPLRIYPIVSIGVGYKF